MKFKMKGQQTKRNKLVATRKNMKNDANFSLFTNKNSYKIGWDLRFRDRTILLRFQRDCLDQSLYNKWLIIFRWILHLILFSDIYSNHSFMLLLLMPIAPILIDLGCIHLEKSFILSRAYYILYATMFNDLLFETSKLRYLFIIFGFFADLSITMPFSYHLISDI